MAAVEKPPTERQIPKVMNGWLGCDEVERMPGKVSSAWVFKGTRVPVRALFENIEDGATVDDFLEWFPGVRRDQVAAVLEHVVTSLVPETTR